MNVTSDLLTPAFRAGQPSANAILRQLSHDTPLALAGLLVPTLLLYLSLYALLNARHALYNALTALTLVSFWLYPSAAPVQCASVRCLQNLAVSVGTMKTLDLFTKRHALPKYTASPAPPAHILALLYATELRYESFAPNSIRSPPSPSSPAAYSEPNQLLVHIALFGAFQLLPQTPVVLGISILLSIYILWTSLQLLLRYKSSPPLFQPLYRGHSLAGLWTETWHSCFASPCLSLAYKPASKLLRRMGLPEQAARAGGVMAAFAAMAAFHVHGLAPLVSNDGLWRIWWFFLANGALVVLETAVWGKKKHWVRTLVAWGVEGVMASWCIRGLRIPQGVGHVTWGDVCGVGGR
ncbi:hypothetical protein BJ546DRAFT_227031 [Cryomyces antarcticus]|nr:hypothetical protein LTR04_006540 [Oleoguttula sp. CCFEE 6159]